MSIFIPNNSTPGPPPPPVLPMAWLSQPAKRLYWTLQAPLSTAITVMPLDLNPDTLREAYFRQTLAGTTWHPVSESPISEPPVASVEEGLDEADEPEGEPPEFGPLVVTASNGQYVMVHDYVIAVHPWLMEQKVQILKARNVVEDDDYEPAGNERLLLQLDRPAMISAEDEDEWKESLRWRFRNGGT
ncbi:hypothetical protein BKA65DRAFT_581752 [Rhexocercosporidium sp. MPI-PUGE-AT-0058]|nr:hypothetical protein BKA65DRAFT_581752 [Rhexocercosporidium sp. MPI-PUGE-AT-0058]